MVMTKTNLPPEHESTLAFAPPAIFCAKGCSCWHCRTLALANQGRVTRYWWREWPVSLRLGDEKNCWEPQFSLNHLLLWSWFTFYFSSLWTQSESTTWKYLRFFSSGKFWDIFSFIVAFSLTSPSGTLVGKCHSSSVFLNLAFIIFLSFSVFWIYSFCLLPCGLQLNPSTDFFFTIVFFRCQNSTWYFLDSPHLFSSSPILAL